MLFAAAVMWRNETIADRNRVWRAALLEQQQDLPRADIERLDALVAAHRLETKDAGIEIAAAPNIGHIECGFDQTFKRRAVQATTSSAQPALPRSCVTRPTADRIPC